MVNYGLVCPECKSIDIIEKQFIEKDITEFDTYIDTYQCNDCNYFGDVGKFLDNKLIENGE